MPSALATQQKLWGTVYLAPALTLLSVFVFIPILLTAWISLHEWSMYTGLGDMHYVGLQNYRELAQDGAFKQALQHTAVFSLGSVLLIVPLAVLLGTFLYQTTSRANGIARTIMFVPYVIPTLTAAIVWGYLYAPSSGPFSQLANTLGWHNAAFLSDPRQAMASLIVFNLWQTLGYYTVLIGAGITQIPRTYYEAAELDGAGRLAQLWHITLPLLRRSLIFVVIIAMINTLQIFDPVYALTQGGPSESTTVLSFQIYRTAFEYGLAGKASAMAFILMALLTVAMVAFTYVSRSNLEDGA